jgi:hypothetical protein
MSSLNEMKKISYWFSIAFGIVLSLFISYFTGLFNTPNRAISFEEKQYNDTLFTDAAGQAQKAAVLNGAIWNSGKTAIDTSEVRESLTITLDESQRILAYKIIKQTNPITSRFSLNQTDSSTLRVGWQYFDPNNGFSFQIIYTGSKRAKLSPAGRILYVNEYTRVNPLLRFALGVIIFFIFTGIAAFSICTYLFFKKQYYGFAEMIVLLIGAASSLGLAFLFIPVLIETLRYPNFESIIK